MFPGRGSIITRDSWFPGRGTHMIRVLRLPSRETHIPSDSVPLPRRFSRDMCFLGRGTHITRHMCVGGGKKMSVQILPPFPKKTMLRCAWIISDLQ